MRVQASSRFAFGATTAALVTLASGGIAVLVNYGTSSVGAATSLPSGGALPDTVPPGAVIVDRVAGTFVAKPPVDKTVQALQNALAHRGLPGRRTLTARLIDLAGPAGPDVSAAPQLIVTPAVAITPRVTGRPSGPVAAPVPVHKPRVPHLPKPSKGPIPVTRPEPPGPGVGNGHDGRHDGAEHDGHKGRHADKAHDGQKAQKAQKAHQGHKAHESARRGAHERDGHGAHERCSHHGHHDQGKHAKSRHSR